MTSEDSLHSDVDSWLENVPEGRCPGAWVAEQFGVMLAEVKAEAQAEVVEAFSYHLGGANLHAMEAVRERFGIPAPASSSTETEGH